MQLNQDQLRVIDSAMAFLLSPSERFMVIKGRAGTGKSTLTEALIPEINKQLSVISLILQENESKPVLLTATTNKAAKVTADISNEDATTIHSLLRLRVRQDYQTGETKLTRNAGAEVIKNSVIIIDEAFYIDPLLQKYINDCTMNCKIIFIGDPYQCAPVRQTHSPIEDLVCRTEELTQVMRNSGVLTTLGEHWRDTVISGVFSPFAHSAPGIIDWVDSATFQQEIEQSYINSVGENQNKIVCWTNKQADAYSHFVRNLKGYPNEFVEGEYLQVMNSLPKLGIRTDTIIQIKTFSSVDRRSGIDGRYARTTRGDDLFIPNSSEEYSIAVKTAAKQKNWSLYFDIQETIPDLRAIHACTIHKAQGSTYDTVFIDLPDIGKCNIASDVARMMHVAVTRARHRVVFRGKLPAKYGG